ncbi:MAG: 2-iminoacetate synthase ThiH [Oscillospiraceae bacterium]|nr:2-iminoacetate synthase ThiH [Oscillospiraceae bacterium]
MRDHMQYLPGMEVLEDSEIGARVVQAMENYNCRHYSAADVEQALTAEYPSLEDFGALLSPAAEPFLEAMARRATEETHKHFGSSVLLFTPLYISNYCENHCIYCGFNCTNNIRRAKLDEAGIRREMEAIAKTGMEEVLILTGESRGMSNVEYIGRACTIAREFFKNVGIEVYPMNTDEYAYVHSCGADYVTVFQETYDSERYAQLHLAGHKRVFPYRLNAQERALRGGMRGVAFAALLGLSDFRKDAFAVGTHAYLIQRAYPHAEISFSCPRLRPIINNDQINPKDVHERQLLQIMCAYRIFMPFAGLTISTRERAEFRDHVIGMCATKISAGVSTGIGSHTKEASEGVGDAQFEISDERSLEEVIAAIRRRGLQPVLNDYVYI